MSEVAPKIIEHPQHDPSMGFDNRVHIKDAKTGRLIRIQNYARHCKGDQVLLERPVGSGNCFYENGSPAGRWSFPIVGKEAHWKRLSEDHIEVKAAPANHTELLSQENEELQKEIASLRAEAEELRKDKAKLQQK